jgi:hypothetical protein
MLLSTPADSKMVKTRDRQWSSKNEVAGFIYDLFMGPKDKNCRPLRIKRESWGGVVMFQIPVVKWTRKLRNERR